jgi:hypothetical protein
LGLEGPNQDTIGGEEIRHGSSLSKELGVGQNIEAAVGLGVRLKDGAHRLRGAAWHGRLLDNNFRRLRNMRDAACSKLDKAIDINIYISDPYATND